MKRLSLFIIASALLSSSDCMARPAQPACPIEGELVQWIADACMAKLETDDEIAAGDCIAAELVTVEGDECAAKRRYKQTMCELARARGTSTASLEECLADPAFVGSTVRNGGVGKQPADR